MNDDTEKLVRLIISVHKELIGPYAIEKANKVEGLTVSYDLQQIEIQGDTKEIVNKLVKQYLGIFGNTSIQLCKEAREDLLPSFPKENLPEILQ
ncbi:MAG TPA: hypothetical protein VJ179_04050 [Patescibacteria group bacterium]|nr:hypothetical protein [Patescibacteria group bacterium]